MIACDEQALICDLAETYNIYNYKELPVNYVATLSVGLRANSRIKLKQSEEKQPLETILLASVADSLRILVWQKSEDGLKNINRPQSLLQLLIDNEKPKSNMKSFHSIDDFEKERNRLIKIAEGSDLK